MFPGILPQNYVRIRQAVSPKFLERSTFVCDRFRLQNSTTRPGAAAQPPQIKCANPGCIQGRRTEPAPGGQILSTWEESKAMPLPRLRSKTHLHLHENKCARYHTDR